LDVFGTPETVLLGHLADEGDDLLRSTRSSLIGLGFATPVAAEEVSVPTEEGLWLDDEKCLFPEPGASGEEDEREAVAAGEFWSLDLAAEYSDLLTEECVLDEQFGAAACEVGQGRGDDCE